MKKLNNKMRVISLLLTLTLVVMISGSTMNAATQLPVVLGTVSNFAILAYSGITIIGDSTIIGNVGLYPGTSITGTETATVNGTVHINDAIAITAKDDLATAYNDTKARTPILINAELGGNTLTPGAYAPLVGDSFQITGILTLDAQNDSDAIFIFQTESTLTTASSSDVELINGAQASQIFWQIGSSATLGTNSHFEGNILALVSITATTGSTVHGSLLARNGAVTIDSNTITKAITSLPTPTPTPAPTTAATPTPTPTPTPTNTPINMPTITSALAPTSMSVSTSTSTVTPTSTPTPIPARVIYSLRDDGTVVVTKTVIGGQLPDTSQNKYTVLLIGSALLLLAVVGWRSSKRFE